MPSSAFKTCALDRKSTRLNSSHTINSYAVFCLKKNRRRHRGDSNTRICPPVHPRSRRVALALGVAAADVWAPRTRRGDDWYSAPLLFFNDTATTEIYALSLHDALPI